MWRVYGSALSASKKIDGISGSGFLSTPTSCSAQLPSCSFVSSLPEKKLRIPSISGLLQKSDTPSEEQYLGANDMTISDAQQ
jgi:hypothetical protein